MRMRVEYQSKDTALEVHGPFMNGVIPSGQNGISEGASRDVAGSSASRLFMRMHWSINAVATLLIAAATATAQTPQSDPPVPSVDTQTADPQAKEQGKEQPPPPIEGTGWRSLVKDTGRDFASFPRRKSTWVLLAGGGALALAAHPADDYVQEHIVGNQTAEHIFALGKVLGSAEFQIGTAVTLLLIGHHIGPKDGKTNKLSHLGFDLIRAQIVTQSIVQGIKYSVQRDRPTGECCAFPSGHAASAFAAASVLERHLGYRGWWPVLAGATYVATSRLVDNRHFLSDVVFGAAVGEATGWTVVGRHGKSQFALQPMPVRGGVMLAFVRTGD
jgi:membrane-associated phospholipid phosphatase